MTTYFETQLTKVKKFDYAKKLMMPKHCKRSTL